MDQQVSLSLSSGKSFKLKNPIMTASGTFGYGLEFSRFGDLASLGAIVVKGLSLKARAGNPTPRITETACGMLNAIGLQNCGIDTFLKMYLPSLPWQETPIIANMYATSVAEFGTLARELGQVEKIAGLEVNISCPNVKEGGMQFGQDPVAAAQVTSAVKEKSNGKPVIVKLSPNVTDIAAMAKAVEAAGADCISCINTLTGMAVNIRTRKPSLANGIGGLSGPAIKPVALRCVWQVSQAVSIPVIGIGGITSAEDVLEFILAGAAAVQIGTANFMRPDNAFTLVDRVKTLAESLNIPNWDAWRGTLQM